MEVNVLKNRARYESSTTEVNVIKNRARYEISTTEVNVLKIELGMSQARQK